MAFHSYSYYRIPNSYALAIGRMDLKEIETHA